LNDYYNGSEGKGTQDSKGGQVYFKFNVTGVADPNKKGVKQSDVDNKYVQISNDNGIPAVSQYDPSINVIAPAAVITNELSTDLGSSGEGRSGHVIKTRGSEGTISHEVGHTLLLQDNGYQSGGLMNSPANAIIPSEVDTILKQAYDRK